MMKKIISLLLASALVLCFAACNRDGSTTETSTADGNTSDSVENGDIIPTKQADALPSDGLKTGMKEKLSPIEYSAYNDLFFNKNYDAYKDKEFTKDGTFAVLYDAYNSVTRYYVWGYADNTKCCDYQWEFVMPQGAEIPAAGSYIKVKGTMTQDEKALDGFWLTDTEIEVQEEFTPADVNMDMTTMSSTLVRVEMQNMMMFPEKFKGQTLLVFGRALTPGAIQHPYYDNAWSMHFTEGDKVPAIGQYMLLEGTFEGNEEEQKINTSEITFIG